MTDAHREQIAQWIADETGAAWDDKLDQADRIIAYLEHREESLLVRLNDLVTLIENVAPDYSEQYAVRRARAVIEGSAHMTDDHIIEQLARACCLSQDKDPDSELFCNGVTPGADRAWQHPMILIEAKHFLAMWRVMQDQEEETYTFNRKQIDERDSIMANEAAEQTLTRAENVIRKMCGLSSREGDTISRSDALALLSALRKTT